MGGRIGNNPTPKPVIVPGCWGQKIGTVFDDSLIKWQMRNNDLTTFMFKKRGFILRLCWKSLSGQCFVSQKTTEKNERWTVSPLKKRCADLASRGRPLFYISASLSSQRCFFYLSLYLVQSEGCAKNNATQNSPWRILIRAFSEPSGTRLRGNSTFLSGRDHSQIWTQTENPRWFYENNHVSKIQRVSKSCIFAGPNNPL